MNVDHANNIAPLTIHMSFRIQVKVCAYRLDTLPLAKRGFNVEQTTLLKNGLIITKKKVPIMKNQCKNIQDLHCQLSLDQTTETQA